MRSRSIWHSTKRSTVARKFWQWYRVWKPRMSACSIDSSSSFFHGHTPKVSALGQGMCQNTAMVAFTPRSRISLRQQREVEVLHQHHGFVAAGLLRDGVGEARIDRAVVLPVALAEGRAHVGQMAQRPQALVGEAVVVAFFLFVGEPDAAQGVARVIRWHLHVIVAVHHLAVGRAAAVRDPGAGTGAHDGLDRRDHAAGRHLHRPMLAVASWRVDVGLAVRHHQHGAVVELFAHHLLQRLRRPVLAEFDLQSLVRLHLAHCLAHAHQDRRGIPADLASSRNRRLRMSPSSSRIQRFSSSRTNRPTASASKAAPITTDGEHEITRRGLPTVHVREIVDQQHVP